MEISEFIKHKKGTLLDVREPMELMLDGKIDFAINIPVEEIENHLNEIQSYDKPLIIFCRSGNRSGKVIEFLSKKGINELYNGGGYKDICKIIQS